MDVAIVGVGLHPFGRFAGKSALEMGAEAVRDALSDAGARWQDVGCAFAGSMEIANPEAVVGLLGLTGIQASAVLNGCETGNNSLIMAAQAAAPSGHDLAIAIGLDKHPRGAFAAVPAVSGLTSWYGEVCFCLTTHIFDMKITRYMHDHGISRETLARAAANNFRNGSINPK